MARRWWEHIPRRYWTAVDWAQWDKEGQPRIPADMRTQQPPPLDAPPIVPPPGPQSAVTSLHAKPRKRGVDGAHSRGVDKLLEELDIR